MNLRRLLVDARKFLAEELSQIGICKKIAHKSKEVSDAEKELRSIIERIDDFLSQHSSHYTTHILHIFYAFQSTIDRWEDAELAGLTTPGWYFHTEDYATCMGPYPDFDGAIQEYETYIHSLDQPKENP